MKNYLMEFFELEEQDVSKEEIEHAMVAVAWITFLLTAFYFFIGSL